ncbi:MULTISPECIES: hypothetical protein [Burkholderia]|uniref:hypothetical protein n=1 Tax=Burkholderia TaxID=32008 RepID=UPI000B29FC09|nr:MULTISPECIES: hypothetical protein [unclassified Burkholderia]
MPTFSILTTYNQKVYCLGLNNNTGGALAYPVIDVNNVANLLKWEVYPSPQVGIRATLFNTGQRLYLAYGPSNELGVASTPSAATLFLLAGTSVPTQYQIATASESPPRKLIVNTSVTTSGSLNIILSSGSGTTNWSFHGY